MQHKAFELFCETHRTAIHHIKKQLGEKVYRLIEASPCWEILDPFCYFGNSDGIKQFIYLCAALLKDGADYAQLHQQFAYMVFDCTEIGYADGPASDEVFKTRKQALSAMQQVQSETTTHFQLMPLLAYEICSYEEMQTWFDTHRDKEPTNPFVQIIDRAILCDTFRDCYLPDEWNNLGGAAGIQKERNIFLKSLEEYAKPYPSLLSQIEVLMNSDFMSEFGYPILNQTEPLREIMRKVNSHQLQTINQLNSSLATPNKAASVMPNYPKMPEPQVPSITSSFCSFPAVKESSAQPMELEPSEKVEKNLTNCNL